jgi:hypothetical protein
MKNSPSTPSPDEMFSLGENAASEGNQEPNWKLATDDKFVLVDVPNVNHYTLVREPTVNLLAAVIQDITTRTDVTARE